MKHFLRIVVLILFIFASACNPQSNTINNKGEPVDSTLLPTVLPGTMEVEESPAAAGAEPADCLEGETSLVGKSIADEYDSVDYAQVITWFCNGAEFEDILVALETEAQTDTPAGDLLQMLADGFTWNDIWKINGLMD